MSGESYLIQPEVKYRKYFPTKHNHKRKTFLYHLQRSLILELVISPNQTTILALEWRMQRCFPSQWYPRQLN